MKKTEFEEFCNEFEFEGCNGCIYEEIKNRPKCKKQFDSDSSKYITELELKCLIGSLNRILGDLRKRIDLL